MLEPANRQMTDSTENVIQNNFYRFLVDFSDYARTAENPLIDPLKDQRNNQKRDKKCTKIAGFTVRRKTVRFKSCTKVCSLKSFGWINLIPLDEYGLGQVDLDQGRLVRNKVRNGYSRSVSKTDSKSTEKKINETLIVSLHRFRLPVKRQMGLFEFGGKDGFEDESQK